MNAFLAFFLNLLAITIFTSLMALYSRKHQNSIFLAMVYISYITLSQILALKIAVFDFGLFTLIAPAGTLIFVNSINITDMTYEFFGKREANRLVLNAFLIQVIVVLLVYTAVSLETSTSSTVTQTEFEAIFLLTIPIIIASRFALLGSGLLDVWIYDYLRQYTHGGKLWVRSLVSDLLSLFVDTLIFIPIAFWADLSVTVIGSLILGQTLIKWILGLINTPLLYFARDLFEGKYMVHVPFLSYFNPDHTEL